MSKVTLANRRGPLIYYRLTLSFSSEWREDISYPPLTDTTKNVNEKRKRKAMSSILCEITFLTELYDFTSFVLIRSLHELAERSSEYNN